MTDLNFQVARVLEIDPERVNLVREPVWDWRKMDFVDRLWIEIQGITKDEYERYRGLLREEFRCLLMPHDSGYLRHPSPPNHMRRWKLPPEAYSEIERRMKQRLAYELRHHLARGRMRT